MSDDARHPRAGAGSPGVHRLAVATACVSLLPIVVGALVTTLGAGMAFLDWPTSDGQNMLLYPWLKDLAAGRTDAFVEHGHRLAGVVIGLFSMALAAAAWRWDRRSAVRWMATAALIGVVVQGLLGGARVVQDERVLAMLHGSLAALVFSLLVVLAVVSRPRPEEGQNETADLRRLKPLAFVAPAAILGQYVVGGLLRHLNFALYEHIGLAVIVFGLVVAAGVGGTLIGTRCVRRTAALLLLLVTVQVGLGLGAFVTRFGLPFAGYVAVQQSMPQIWFRTSHTVVGMLLLATSAVYVVQVVRSSTTQQPAPSGVSLGTAVPTGGAS